MLNWKIKNNVISELIYNDKNIINPWGIEATDSRSFFSIESGFGQRCKIIDQQSYLKGNTFQIRQHVKMNEGEWQLEVIEELLENKVIRTAKLICIKESFFVDLCFRFRFRKEFFSEAIIANEKLIHSESNTYHQFPVKEVILSGKKQAMKIKIISCESQGKFIPLVNLKDCKNEWVMQARLLPKTSDKEIIKLSSKFFNEAPIPELITKLILKNKKIKEYLWYHAEHSPYNNFIAKVFAPNAFPLAKLRSGQELKIKVELQIFEE